MNFTYLKQALFALSVSFLFTTLNAQDFENAFSVGGSPLGDGTQDLFVDAAGNFYAAGYAQQLSPTNSHQIFDTLSISTSFTNYGGVDGFLAKFNANGTVAWGLGIGGNSNTSAEEAYAVAVDGNGDVYVAGHFNGDSLKYSGGSIPKTGGAGDEDAFLIKVNAQGVVLWANSYGFSGDQEIEDIEVLASGDVIIAGTVGDSLNLGGASLIGDGNLFIASLQPNGNLNWQKQTTGGSTANTIGQLAIDGQDQIYLGGQNNGQGLSGSGSFFGGYLVKLSSSGSLIWEKSIAGGDNNIAAVSLNGSGGLFVSGDFNVTLSFTGSAVSFSPSQQDGFIAKFDTAGNFENAFQLKSSGNDFVNGLSTPNSKDVFFTGSFDGFQVEVLDSAGFIVNDAFQIGGEDFYVAQTTDSLVGCQVQVYGNSTAGDRSFALTADQNHVYCGGRFIGNQLYVNNPTSGVSVPGAGPSAFVVQYSYSPSVSQPPVTTIPQYDITFQVDMQNENVSAGVNLSYFISGGTLQDTAMVNTTADEYTITLSIDSGMPIYYRFQNGTTFEQVPFQCNEYDSLGNQTRIHIVSKNDSIPLVCFSSCSNCIPKPVCQVGTPTAINGPSSGFCLGDQEVGYNVAPIAGATQHIWYIASGNQTIGGGQGTPSVKVNMDDAGAAVVAVYGTDGTCNGDTTTLNLSAPNSAVGFEIAVNQTPNCGKADGELEIINLVGGSTFNYQWTNGETAGTIDSVSGGVYEVTVTANTGCTSTEAISLASSGAPSISATPTQPSCFGGNDGEIDITVSGGNQPYQVKWLTGQTTQDIQNLSAGGYYVEVIDNSGCVAFECVEVTEPQPISVSATIVNPTSCGASNGFISLNGSGGVGGLNYAWSSGSTGPTLNAISGGIYKVTVTDVNSCTYDTVIGVSDSGGVKVVLDEVLATTCGNNHGHISVSTLNAVNPSFSWSSGDTTEAISSLASGWYELEVSDSNCVAAVAAEVKEIAPHPLEICMVTVDDTTGNNLVVFDKTAADSLTTTFNVYRESCLSDQFLWVGSLSQGDLSQFEDVNSDPNVKSWKYKITTEDACGNESFSSAFQKTIHTTVQGDTIGGTEISWNPYIGFEYDWFFVERYNSQSGWVLLDSVPDTQLSYTDANPQGAAADIQYSVFVKHPFGCTAYEANKNYNSARSNRSGIPPMLNVPDTTNPDTTNPGTAQLKVVQHSFSLFPNPTVSQVQLKFTQPLPTLVEVKFIDLKGRTLVNSIKIAEGESKATLDVSNLSAGLYLIQVQGTKFLVRRRLLVNR